MATLKIDREKAEELVGEVLELSEKLDKLSIKNKKKNLTAFWGISIDKEVVIKNEQVKTCLDSNPELKVIHKSTHSTLVYIGKKPDDPREAKYVPLEKKECTLTVDAFGYSENALALRVIKMTCLEEGKEMDVPSDAVQQHITVALKDGVPAKDSVETLLGAGTIVKFDALMILIGRITRYLY